jgi:hypothetical protein
VQGVPDFQKSQTTKEVVRRDDLIESHLMPFLAAGDGKLARYDMASATLQPVLVDAPTLG